MMMSTKQRLSSVAAERQRRDRFNKAVQGIHNVLQISDREKKVQKENVLLSAAAQISTNRALRDEVEELRRENAELEGKLEKMSTRQHSKEGKEGVTVVRNNNESNDTVKPGGDFGVCFRSVFYNSGCCFAVADIRCNFIELNREFMELLNCKCKLEDVRNAGLNGLKLTPKEDYPTVIESLAKLVKNNVPSVTMVKGLFVRSGEVIQVKTTLILTRDPHTKEPSEILVYMIPSNPH